MSRAPHSNQPDADAERLLLTLADHLHEHCTCAPGQPRCAACDLRGQLRSVREELLAWRAEGRRLAQRRDEAIANGGDHERRDGGACAECAALATLARTVLGDR
ncbi:MAG: hypothetical protein JWN72_771 [Thermoleophilia bacterium]|nr:hypothetical protein [Thermoleophilia bacterium]